MKPRSATMATVATMIVTPDDYRRTAAVTVDPGPQITVAIVATVAPRSHVLDFLPGSRMARAKQRREECRTDQSSGTFLFSLFAGGSTEGSRPFVRGAGAQCPARVKGSRPFGTR